MSILHLATNTIIVSRLVLVSGNKYALSTVTSVRGNLQPLKIDGETLADGLFGRTFQFFVEEGTDIQSGDKLRDENNNYYKVADNGVVTRTSGGAIDHVKVICERIENI